MRAGRGREGSSAYAPQGFGGGGRQSRPPSFGREDPRPRPTRFTSAPLWKTPSGLRTERSAALRRARGTGVRSAGAEAGGSVVPPADSNPSGAEADRIPVPLAPAEELSGAEGPAAVSGGGRRGGRRRWRWWRPRRRPPGRPRTGRGCCRATRCVRAISLAQRVRVGEAVVLVLGHHLEDHRVDRGGMFTLSDAASTAAAARASCGS